MSDINKMLDERGSRYGNFMDHAKITQQLKGIVNAYAGDKLDFDQIEALDMICHKMGRILNGDPDYEDSWLDIAGYAKLVADRLREDESIRQPGFQEAVDSMRLPG